MNITPGTRGRPALLITSFVVVLGLLAAVAPLVQQALRVPWDVLSLIMLGPAIATGLLWLVARRLFPSDWPAVPWREVVLPLLLAALFCVAYLVTLSVLAGRAPRLPAAVSGVPVVAFIALQALGALGEEIGWRGTMQMAGERLMRPTVSAVVMGALFGATHIGYWGLGPAFVAAFTLSSVLMTLSMSLVWHGSFWQRVAVTTLIHLGVNLSLFAVPVDMTTSPPWLLPVPALVSTLVVAAPALLVRRQRARSGATPAAVVPAT